MPPMIIESSSSSFSSTRPTHLHRRTEAKHRNEGSPSSWPVRVRDSLFNRPAAKAKRKSYSRGDDSLMDRAAALPRQVKPKNGNPLESKINKGKNKVDTVEKTQQGQHEDLASDVGTVKRNPKCETLSDVDNLLSIPGTWVDRNNHIRTVSRDDYLTARGANPRTGVISPSIASCSQHSNSVCCHGERYENKDRKMDKKWRLKGDQWISLDKNEKTPLPSPSPGKSDDNFVSDIEGRARSYIRRLQQRGVRHSQVGDQFVVNMPSAKEPCPPSMTTHQILEFQKAVDRIHKIGEKFLDPNSPPTPPEPVQDGPSTPPRKLSRTRAVHSRGHPMIRVEGSPRCVRGPTDTKKRQGSTSEQKHFLGISKVRGIQNLDGLSFPSAQWMTAMLSETDLEQGISPVTKQRQIENMATTQHQYSGVCPGSLLERRGKMSLSLNPLQIAMPLLCPSTTPQEPAFTIITTMTNTPTQSPHHHQRLEPDGDINLDLAKDRERRCASASLISRSSPAAGFVAVDRAEDMWNTENKILGPAMDVYMEGSIQTPAIQNHDTKSKNAACFRDHRSRAFVFLIVRRAIEISMQCLALMLELCKHLVASTSKSDLRTINPAASDTMQHLIDFISLVLMAYAIWKTLVCIVNLVIYAIVQYGGYMGALVLLFNWMSRSTSSAVISP
ncbi:hypothetical protein PRK78_005021 [Emydomyces testavorans]|uniref:Uncharacterized protein n=1 Tax=Emydomyces testavorans TaxID=2070801 RepID=A0AAF0IK49_9EURO|nr:hypothetical protein PRK78_005021 [Emydomyces testavorans]